eukprot:CAMPEP_0197520628 /NCGR_PEP_ID=MMETSP1318-20131121/5974_1 /TAXON_ID=552666 /ORGANISM="Partenskyella glossopodia, Strain RCC365" /LENGTH=346 /DNA_ID=CAMNT_0043072295 /DNA_START=49 /DNA_END=1086 /DNA_ORIENTATION=+
MPKYKPICKVLTFDTKWPANRTSDLFQAIRSKLPNSIQLKDLETVASDFDPRKLAVAKMYTYYVTEDPYPSPFLARYVWAPIKGEKRSLNIDGMREAASYLLGKHNFTRFGALEKECQYDRSPIKNIYGIYLKRKERVTSITVVGDAFLWRMVRRIAGTLVQVGLGNIHPNSTREILINPDRIPKGPLKKHPLVYTAPACGLFLDRVMYNESEIANVREEYEDSETFAALSAATGAASRAMAQIGRIFLHFADKLDKCGNNNPDSPDRTNTVLEAHLKHRISGERTLNTCNTGTDSRDSYNTPGCFSCLLPGQYYMHVHKTEHLGQGIVGMRKCTIGEGVLRCVVW